MRRSLGAALVLLTALTSLTPAAVAAPPDPVRIMIVGDSVVQGSAGDWTWRYRLHQMLDAAGVDVDFVGPHTDVFDNVSGELGSQAYADPAFDDREHAARWGATLSEPADSMASLVEEFDPDVVVEARGFNDLGWMGLPAEEVDDLVSDEIAEARAAAPEVDFVVAALPQDWSEEIGSYNASLPALAAGLSGPDSSVVVSDTGHGFEEYVDTWDPAHLAATGEVKMAAGVAEALAELGIGTGAGTLPVVRNGHWGGATLAVAPGERKAALTWSGPPGAREELVWTRDLTACADWIRLPVALEGTSWEATGLVPGHRYDFRLQAAKGTAISDGFSNVVGVVVAGSDPWPRQACAPTTVVATPGLNRLTVDWAPVSTATSYDVIWTSDVPGDNGARSVAGGPVVLGGLVGGRVYRVSVAARNAAPGSGAAVVTQGTPTAPAPEPMGRPSRVVVAPGSHRLDVTWSPAAGATAYDVTWAGRKLHLRGQAAVSGPAVAITNVLAGERYDVTITPLNAAGSGPAVTVVGVPRGPEVAAPTQLRARQTGAHRALLTWRHRPAASSYSVQVRRRGRWEPVRTVVATALVVRGLPRGVASFRVRPWHQLVAGRWSHEVRVRMR
ncbi:hypothetical protein GCM10023350_51450 [Nocardioides endophyticus]|uniref:Fibronectin type-III domain-containing protein n=1 Tax=Nocardioides endophyticus TaxID=1353775 RepID=A0ABP8ZLG5_9ACTN